MPDQASSEGLSSARQELYTASPFYQALVVASAVALGATMGVVGWREWNYRAPKKETPQTLEQVSGHIEEKLSPPGKIHVGE